MSVQSHVAVGSFADGVDSFSPTIQDLQAMPGESSSSPSSSPEQLQQITQITQPMEPTPAPSTIRACYTDLTFEGVMEDLSSRFILNLPDEEMQSVERICFQVEQAHWFYEDFVRDDNKNRFPSYALKTFSNKLFQACPILHQWRDDHDAAFTRFMDYKVRVPVCGAIMLNATWDKCVLVKGWKTSSGWGFPKGKINQGEEPHLCAVREVLEETGYDLLDQINADDVLTSYAREQHCSLYIVPGVSEEFPFETKTRKEISKIEWFKLTDLPGYKRKATNVPPGKFFLISPFINGLRSFVHEHKPAGLRKGKKGKPSHDSPAAPLKAPQESSPQTSSAENNGPQTPSPKYSDTLVHIDTQGPSEAISSIDPHFASLLNSLTMSAGTPQESKVTSRASPAPKPELSRAPSVLGRPSSQMSTNTTTNSQTLQPGSALSPLSIVPAVATKSPQDQPPTPPSASLSYGSATTQSTGTSGQSSVPSRRGPSSHRSSSTADISPYLARPMQAEPVSGKRLKQMALLEGLANESARMTPILRAASVHPDRVPMPMYHGQGPYGFPPPPFMGVPHPNDIITYSSTPGLGPGLVPPPPAIPHSFDHSVHDDAFQVRPRTSHQFQRLHMPQSQGNMQRVSMNQAQLMSAMHAPVPMRAPPGLYAPSPMPVSHIPQGFVPYGPPQPYAFPARNNVGLSASQYQMMPSMKPRTSAVDPALLAILNGGSTTNGL